MERPLGWHACYSASYRRYRYTLYNGRRPNLFLAPWSWHRYQSRLDEQAMEQALHGLLGSHDFAAFQRAGSRRSHSRTTIQDVSLQRRGDLIHFEIQASGFLYGMVRLLTGQLVAVGEHRLTPEHFERRWKERRRSEVKDGAPAQGLCLLRAGYSETIFSKGGWYDCQPTFFSGYGGSATGSSGMANQCLNGRLHSTDSIREVDLRQVQSFFERCKARHGVAHAPCPASSLATGHNRTGMPAR